MSLILSIETATATCSVALHNAGKLVAHTALLTNRSHAEYLMVIIEDILKISKHDRKELSAIAISSGPGSYTGLRIGTAVGKGLCYGLGIPLIAVPTLEAMANGMRPFTDADTLLCPAIDARRTAIYTLIADQRGHIKKATHIALLDSETYIKSLPDQKLLFFGEDAIKCKHFFMNHKNIHFIEGVCPSAIPIGPLAFAKFQQQLWEEMATYEPCYISQFQEK
ncbi:tRNA (adenosine(37)-N6)-threonylcarbamoyltransferase complex dimerization subunit type 1 TsaB [Candidatus Cardinium hertigii]|nr:tRNA (adenosine(37)-N6)-threonylcarbamoyltransferase complex dimerization subunit type 1 TsaB [Candidatus Cardinium hertigii]